MRYIPSLCGRYSLYSIKIQLLAMNLDISYVQILSQKLNFYWTERVLVFMLVKRCMLLQEVYTSC